MNDRLLQEISSRCLASRFGPGQKQTRRQSQQGDFAAENHRRWFFSTRREQDEPIPPGLVGAKQVDLGLLCGQTRVDGNKTKPSEPAEAIGSGCSIFSVNRDVWVLTVRTCWALWWCHSLEMRRGRSRPVATRRRPVFQRHFSIDRVRPFDPHLKWWTSLVEMNGDSPKAGPLDPFGILR